MADERYTRKGSLYKAQQTSIKEPRAPKTQDISHLSRSTYYLALHQTIASSLKPLASFFDAEQREAEPEMQAPDYGQQFVPEIDNFEKIAATISILKDKPFKRCLLSQYHRFVKYFLNQAEIPGQTLSYLKETGFSSRFERGFHSPLAPFISSEIAKKISTGAEMPWKDPARDAFFQLFLQILPPWMEKMLLEGKGKQEIRSKIPSMKSGAYGYLDEIPTPPADELALVPLLSDFEEVEETRIGENLYCYILSHRTHELDNIQVSYDAAREVFVVEGVGFTRKSMDGAPVNPQVIVNYETGRETRVYQFGDGFGGTVTEIEVFDSSGLLTMRSIEKSGSDGSRELRESVYERGFLSEWSVEISCKDVLDVKRRYLCNYDRGNYLTHVKEQSVIVLPRISAVEDLGLRELREARFLQDYSVNHRLQMDILSQWTPQGRSYSLKERRIDLKIPGVLSGFIQESPGEDYVLLSEFQDSRGQVVFRRSSTSDDNDNVKNFLLEDRKERMSWEQKLYYGRDDALMSIHSIFREPSEFDGARTGMPHYQRNTYLLPGSVLCILEKYYNTFAHKEEKHYHRYFEKLLGSRWIRPVEVKYTDTGEFIVSFRYETFPDCVIEEHRHYMGEDFFEVSCQVRKKVKKENLEEERLVKRRRDSREETVEYLRKKADNEYRETTTVKDTHIDRFIRSRKISDKIPLDFFPEPNRWLDFSTPGTAGIRSYVSTYVHERINTSRFPPDRTIIVREETYECEIPGEDRRDILNFLAFLDDAGVTHFRTKATGWRREYERTFIWEDGELIQQFETPHKKKPRKPSDPTLGSFSRNL